MNKLQTILAMGFMLVANSVFAQHNNQATITSQPADARGTALTTSSASTNDVSLTTAGSAVNILNADYALSKQEIDRREQEVRLRNTTNIPTNTKESVPYKNGDVEA